MNKQNENSIRTFIFRIIIFAVLFFSGWLATVFVAANLSLDLQEYFRRYSNIPVSFARRGDSSLRRFTEIKEYKDVDILFLGSSHCYRGFDPRIFDKHGYSSFNMGSTNQTPLNTYYMLRDNLDRLNPKLVIFEVYPRVLQGSGLESFLDLSDNLPFTKNVIEMGLATHEIRGVNGILARMFEMDRPQLDQIPENIHVGDTYIPGGYVEKDPSFEGERNYKVQSYAMRESQVEYLNDILTIFKEKNIKTFLVCQPIPRELIEASLNYDELIDEMNEIADQHEFPFIDFNALLDLDAQEYFYDADHLRQTGVEVFNKLLIEKIHEMNLLPKRSSANEEVSN